MARRQSSFGFFGVFGRSGDLRQLDQAMRAADLHPALVPEGAKLTIVNLMKDYYPEEPPPDAYPPVAELVAYCVQGMNAFSAANGPQKTAEQERRMETALVEGDSPDARLILLTLHSGLIHPEVVARYDLSAEEEG